LSSVRSFIHESEKYRRVVGVNYPALLRADALVEGAASLFYSSSRRNVAHAADAVFRLSESQPAEPPATAVASSPTPSVSSGDIREVTIESLGDQGDGTAKVERGYVLIVPGARPEDEVTVEITDVRENFAFTRVQDDSGTSANR
jgi:predicted RNA-binding protein with TRAM domain